MDYLNIMPIRTGVETSSMAIKGWCAAFSSIHGRLNKGDFVLVQLICSCIYNILILYQIKCFIRVISHDVFRRIHPLLNFDKVLQLYLNEMVIYNC